MSGNDSSHLDESHDMPASTHLWGTWELWCDMPQSVGGQDATSRPNHAVVNSSWLSQIKHVGIFDNAEAFWGLFNCILPPSKLPGNYTYFLFRSHIMPMWEHEANRRGGKWILTFSHNFTGSAAAEGEGDGNSKQAEVLLPVDIAWQRLCLAAIGELFPCEEVEICGITVSRAKTRTAFSHGEWKVCVWTRTASAEETQMAIAGFIKELLVSNSIAGSVCVPLAQITPNTALNHNEGAEKGSAPMVLNFVSHRELMEAKQCRAQRGVSSQPFKPKYTLDL